MISKEKEKTTKQTKKQKKENNSTTKKHKNTPKRAFQLSVNFFFFVGVQKRELGPKARTQKNYKNRGFSKAFLEKQMCVTKRPFWDQKNPKSEIPVIIVLAYSSLFQQEKTQTLAETPIFIVF